MPDNEMKAGTIQEDAGDDVTAGMHEPGPLGAGYQFAAGMRDIQIIHCNQSV